MLKQSSPTGLPPDHRDERSSTISKQMDGVNLVLSPSSRECITFQEVSIGQCSCCTQLSQEQHTSTA